MVLVMTLERTMDAECQKRVECNTCGECFENKYSLLQHKSKHSKFSYIKSVRKKYLSHFRYRLRWKKFHVCNFYRKSFNCLMCSKAFIRKRAIEKHMKMCHPNNDLKCLFCDHWCNSYPELIVHSQKHTHEQPYKCSRCGQGFVSLPELTQHEESHVVQEFNCIICGKQFAKNKYLRNHLKIHDKGYECLHCHKKFTNTKQLSVHRSFNERCNVSPCKLCGLQFVYKCQLVKHMDDHKAEFKDGTNLECLCCQKKFSSPAGLTRHIRQNEVGALPCKLCGLLFLYRCQLLKHIGEHSDSLREGYYLQCQLCQKIFTTSQALIKHRISNKETPSPCNFCEKQFDYKCLLVKHFGEHLQEISNGNSQQCLMCHKKFIFKRPFISHLMLNEGKVPLPPCIVCKMKFTYKCQLEEHLIYHEHATFQNGKVLYGCRQCKSQFSTRESLSEHYVKQHKDSVRIVISPNNTNFQVSKSSKFLLLLKKRSPTTDYQGTLSLQSAGIDLSKEGDTPLDSDGGDPLLDRTLEQDHVSSNLAVETNPTQYTKENQLIKNIAGEHKLHGELTRGQFPGDLQEKDSLRVGFLEEENVLGKSPKRKRSPSSLIEDYSTTKCLKVENLTASSHKTNVLQSESYDKGLVDKDIPNKNQLIDDVMGMLSEEKDVPHFPIEHINEKVTSLKLPENNPTPDVSLENNFVFCKSSQEKPPPHSELNNMKSTTQIDVRAFKKKQHVTGRKKRATRPLWKPRRHKCCDCGRRYYKKSNHIEKFHKDDNGIAQTNGYTRIAAVEIRSTDKVSQQKEHSSKSYFCQICRVSFESEVDLKRHGNIHSRNRRKPAVVESQRKDQDVKTDIKLEATNVLRRVLRVHGSKSERLNSAAKLVTERVEKKAKYHCSVCNKIFGIKEPFESHLQLHQKMGWFICCDCGKSYANLSSLTRHRRAIHLTQNASGSRIFQKTTTTILSRKSGNSDTGSNAPSIKKFNRKNTFDTHLAVHDQSGSYVCYDCGKTYQHKSAMYRHRRRHHVSKLLHKVRIKSRIHCSVCGQVFYYKETFEAHMRLHKQEGSCICYDCGKSYSSKSNLNYHRRMHHLQNPMSLVKSLGREKIPSEKSKDLGERHTLRSMKLNQSQSMELSQSEMYKCPACRRRFECKKSFAEHIVLHEKSGWFICCDCSLCFWYKEGLINHRRTHHGEKKIFTGGRTHDIKNPSPTKEESVKLKENKNYPCPDCGKEFLCKKELEEHVHLHDTGGRFVCFECGNSYKYNNGLAYHWRTKHKKREVKSNPVNRTVDNKVMRDDAKQKEKYCCSVCEKEFVFQKNYEVHIRLHKKPGWFTCSHCGNNYKYKQNLLYHQRKNHMEKEAVNESVEKKVMSNSDHISYWKKHFGISSDVQIEVERMLPCKKCGQYYGTTRSDLEKHRATHEKVNVQWFECRVCQKGFVDRVKLEYHEEKHLMAYKRIKEKAMIRTKCGKCGRKFSTRKHLHYHIKTVHVRRELVSKRSRSSLLSEHKKSIIDAKTRPDLIPECKIPKDEREMLISHRKPSPQVNKGNVHKRKIKKFKCHQCSEMFIYKTTLYYHTKKFHGQRVSAAVNNKCDLLSGKKCNEVVPDGGTNSSYVPNDELLSEVGKSNFVAPIEMGISSQIPKGEVISFETAKNIARSSETPKDIARSSETPKDIARSSETSKDIARSSEAPKYIARSSETPEDIARSSETPEDIARSSETLKDIARSSETPEDIARSSETPEDIARSSETSEDIARTSETPKDIARSSETSEDIARSSETPKDIAISSETPKDITRSSETPKDIARSSETPKDIARSSETSKDIDRSSETSEDIARSSETPKDIARASETPKDITRSSETPKDIARSSETPKNIARSSEAPKDIARSSETPKDIARSSETPKDIARSSETSKDIARSSETSEDIARSSETSKDIARSSETPKDTARSSETPEDIARSSETPEDIARSSETPEDIARSSETPEDIARSSETPKDIARSREAPKDNVNSSGAPTGIASSREAPKDVTSSSVNFDDIARSSDIFPYSVSEAVSELGMKCKDSNCSVEDHFGNKDLQNLEPSCKQKLDYQMSDEFYGGDNLITFDEEFEPLIYFQRGEAKVESYSKESSIIKDNSDENPETSDCIASNIAKSNLVNYKLNDVEDVEMVLTNKHCAKSVSLNVNDKLERLGQVECKGKTTLDSKCTSVVAGGGFPKVKSNTVSCLERTPKVSSCLKKVIEEPSIALLRESAKVNLNFVDATKAVAAHKESTRVDDSLKEPFKVAVPEESTFGSTFPHNTSGVAAHSKQLKVFVRKHRNYIPISKSTNQQQSLNINATTEKHTICVRSDPAERILVKPIRVGDFSEKINNAIARKEASNVPTFCKKTVIRVNSFSKGATEDRVPSTFELMAQIPHTKVKNQVVTYPAKPHVYSIPKYETQDATTFLEKSTYLTTLTDKRPAVDSLVGQTSHTNPQRSDLLPVSECIKVKCFSVKLQPKCIVTCTSGRPHECSKGNRCHESSN